MRRSPANSPWAPAAGWKVMASIPGDLAEICPGKRQHLPASRRRLGRLEGMDAGKAVEGRDLLVDPWLYFIVQEPRG
jgi:hypothetical protein